MTHASSSSPLSLPSTQGPPAPLSRAARAGRVALAALPVLATTAKFLFGWAWLSSWPVWGLLLALALVGPFIRRPLPGWRESAATVVRVGVRRGLVALIKWAALALWSRL